MKVKKGYYLVGFVEKNKDFSSYRFMSNEQMEPVDFYDYLKREIAADAHIHPDDLVILAISKIA